MKGAALLFALMATLTAPGPNNDNWPPQRYTGNLKDVRISFDDHNGKLIMKTCGKPDPGTYHFGCSNRSGWFIVIENPCHAPATDDYARQLCHEMAHLHGWGPNHPAE